MIPRRQKKKTRRKVRIFPIILILLLALCGFAYSYLFGSITPDRDIKASEKGRILDGGSAINILLMGIDHRANDVGRSDTLVLLTVDMKKDKAAITSIPRDTRVYIAGNGYDKINHTYAFGGHELTCSTVSELLAAPIDYYALLDTGAFVNIIDTLGGVDITVERPMHYEDPWDENGGLLIDFQPGRQHLDGQKAIEYVRYRDEQGDLGRIGRQQNFTRELISQTKLSELLTKLPALLKASDKALVTNLTVSERCRLATFLAGLKKESFNSSMLPGRPAYLDSISYWLPDIRRARLQLADAMGIEPSETYASHAATDSANYEAELPRGFSVPDIRSSIQPGSYINKDKKKENKGKAPDNKPSTKKSPDKAKTETAGTPKPAGSVMAKNNPETQESAMENRTKNDRRSEDTLSSQTEKSQPAEKAPVKVTVVNSSAINGAGAKVADILRDRGFEVIEVSTGRNELQETRIVVPDANVADFYGLPFPCIIIGGGEAGEAFVNIGADFKM
ncbi:MAG: LCP family protein [Selenomonadaceae bacterium]|nr:LCP family protein [Selenomonadaceae bacterium]